jgi:lambda repressor-like predicted transcriptional regulator
MLDKIKELKKNGVSLTDIEKGAGLSRGALSKSLKVGRWCKTTEAKINQYYMSVIKNLVGKL